MRTLALLLPLLCVADAAIGQCHADTDYSGRVEVHELVAAVNEALIGCATATITPTPTITATPTVTPTWTPHPSNAVLLPLLGTWVPDDGGTSWRLETLGGFFNPQRLFGNRGGAVTVAVYDTTRAFSGSVPDGMDFLLIARDPDSFESVTVAAKLTDPDTLTGIVSPAASGWLACTGKGPDWITAQPYTLRRQ